MATVAPFVVVSPFANERVRQWPAGHFVELIGLIWRHHGWRSLVVGTRAQRASGNLIVRGFSSEIVTNACGAMSWRELVAAVDAAPYVVANNSGVAHLAAARRRWTLCIFAASHSAAEWMPRGPFAVTMARRLPCAPCAIGGDLCPNGVACMADLTAADVFWRFDAVQRAVERRDKLSSDPQCASFISST